MRAALEAVGFAIAVLATGAVVVSALMAVVLPRATQARLPRQTTRVVRGLLRLRVRRVSEFNDRDRVMAMLAPVALVAMLATWLLVIVVAYSVMFFCLGGLSYERALLYSGSSIVTLGTATDPRFWPSLLSYSEAGLGLLLVALFIAYFPSIYAAFTRRETGVTLLQVRAGSPPEPATLLVRYKLIEDSVDLADLWRQWEAWFADIEESHTTFSILVFFRSPQPDRSWITSAGALLDTAALWVGCVEHPLDPAAQLCLRAGFLALRRVADGFAIPYDPDPSPDAPISVTRKEWEAVMDRLAVAGMAVIADRDAAWRAFSGWRVNYDTVLLRLARLVEAPPAPWVSDRSPVFIPGGPSGRTATGSRTGPRRWRG